MKPLRSLRTLALPAALAVMAAGWIALGPAQSQEDGAAAPPAAPVSEEGAAEIVPDVEPQTEAPAAAAQPMPAAVVEVLDSRITATEDRARLVVDLSAPTEFGITLLTDPYRIVVTLAAEGGERPITELTPSTQLVRGYGLTGAGDGRVAAVLELNLPAQVQQSYTLDAFDEQPARLVVDLIPDDPANFVANAAPSQAPPETTAAEAALDGTSFAPGETSGQSGVRPLIVLDPGHGGADGGAESGTGLQEKNIVLAFALKLQQLLVATGRFDVALTRDTDIFLSLDERVALARANQADLFISLHADSFAQEDVRGASVYTRGDEAEDVLARILASEEDAASLVAGFGPPPEAQPAVIDVLVDLLARETRQRSYLAGQALVEQLEPSIQLRRFPLRQADFFVLQAPEIPSVLIELGFLSNSSDSENLTTDAWLDRVAAALARGVATYFDSLATGA